MIALIWFNIVHPGKVMEGKQCDFPSRKERKNMAPRSISDDDMMVLPTREPVKTASPSRKDEVPKTKSLWRVF